MVFNFKNIPFWKLAMHKIIMHTLGEDLKEYLFHTVLTAIDGFVFCNRYIYCLMFDSEKCMIEKNGDILDCCIIKKLSVCLVSFPIYEVPITIIPLAAVSLKVQFLSPVTFIYRIPSINSPFILFRKSKEKIVPIFQTMTYVRRMCEPNHATRLLQVVWFTEKI